MNTVKIEKGDVGCGIEYHGREYEIDPLVGVVERLNQMQGKGISEIKEMILAVVPDFPVEELRVSEIVPVINGITQAIRGIIKNGFSPVE